MLMNYLTELKNSLPKEEFKDLLLDVERDIKFNRINFNKRTSSREFIDLCESMRVVMRR